MFGRRTLSGVMKQKQRRIRWLTASVKAVTKDSDNAEDTPSRQECSGRVLKMRQLLQEDSGVSRSRPEDSGVSLSRQENPGEDRIELHFEGFSSKERVFRKRDRKKKKRFFVLRVSFL
jgi:hypothetical protein